MIIVRIKYLYQCLCKILLLKRLLIISLIKLLKAEVCNSLGIPDTKCVYHSVLISQYRHIIRNSSYRTVVLLYKLLLTVYIFNSYISTEFYNIRIFTSLYFKRISVFDPVIRNFLLISVFYFLLKHTVAVSNAATVCRIIKSCKRIKEACGKSSKTAVSKSRVTLLILYIRQIKTKLI